MPEPEPEFLEFLELLELLEYWCPAEGKVAVCRGVRKPGVAIQEFDPTRGD